MKNTKFYYLLLVVMCQICSMAAAPVGTLTPVPGSPFPSGTAPSGPIRIAFSPIVSGNLFAAVVNTALANNNISVYLVNQLTGTFTRLLPDVPNSGLTPQDIAFYQIPGGLFAAVVSSGSSSVAVYSVNPATGAFTNLPPDVATGTQPTSIAFSPIVSGKMFAAVTNFADATVSIYSVNLTTGALSPVASSPFATGVGTNPIDVAFSPLIAGNLYAAVAKQGTDQISIYSVDLTTGAFTEVVGSPILTGGTLPLGIDFSPVVSGKLFVAATNGGSGSVSVFEVAPTSGTPTAVPGSPFAAGLVPDGIAFSRVVLGNLFAIVSNILDNTVSMYTVDTTTGVFTRLLPDTLTGGTSPIGVAFSPLTLAGNLFAGVTNQNSSNVSVFQVTLSATPISAISLAILGKYC